MAFDKRKKFHDKDKYYRLAKEQGLRSRAAFKLVQINRKYGFLEKATTGVLDLCAAPGGWSQIVARTCGKETSIVAVDLLSIRKLPNVTTIVGDITTDVCRNKIKQALTRTNGMVDVVLHDGAPNVGADYGKDAFVQNELALAACRAAVQHLKPNTGTFVTKVYRSRDYAALHWALSQIFQTVSTFKPSASRPQSAEIFLICQKYNGSSVDPRLLDPKHVFGSTSEIEVTNQTPTVNIFHKAFDKHTRKRNGYDMDFLDATMRHIEPVSKFVSVSQTQAIQLLSTSTGIAFRCHECADGAKAAGPPPTCACQFLLHHPLTTDDVKDHCSDLKLLSKADFKHLLIWRTKMQEALEHKDKGSDDDDSTSDNGADEDVKDEEQDSEQEEEEIQKEISDMRQRRMRERKKLKKKERAVAAKRRRHAAFGMDLNAIDVEDNNKVFSLASIPTDEHLNQLSEVNLDRQTDDQIFGVESDEDVIVGCDSDDDEDNSESDDEKRQRRRERDLDEAYKQYLETTKNGLAKTGTKLAKRSKKLQRQKVLDEVVEDQEMAMTADVTQNVKTYAKMLAGGADSDDDSNDADDSDDGFNADPMTPAEFETKKKKSEDVTAARKNRLIYQFPEDPASVKTARWFSNPLFAAIGKAVTDKSAQEADEDDDDSAGEDTDGEKPTKRQRSMKSSGRSATSETEPTSKRAGNLSAEAIIASLPLTDKQLRHEKRLKQMAKDERKKAKRAAKLGEEDNQFQVVAAEDDHEEEEVDHSLDNLTEAQKKKVLEARELIKAGMGTAVSVDKDDNEVEIVAQDQTLRRMDDRKYDSDHEDYDSDDYARTLAIGTMILRKSKEKAFVDASYNRYAWNDPANLPEWFVDDENKHYRPQLPIPPALLAKMKEKMMALSTKPIAKVAEARARKNKRAKLKLDAAKKKAEALANSSDMSESMKLKAISKALRVQEAKKPGKKYVVAKKGRNNMGVKGAKLVDGRLKNDKRSASRTEKKRKKGKQGGLVGSKKRRHHK